ncbi:MAG: hypothetical protein ABR507_01185 [Actinomycetota bacterium]
MGGRSGPFGRFSSKTTVAFKVFAAIAVFLGGSSVAVASIAHKNALSESAGASWQSDSSDTGGSSASDGNSAGSSTQSPALDQDSAALDFLKSLVAAAPAKASSSGSVGVQVSAAPGAKARSKAHDVAAKATRPKGSRSSGSSQPAASPAPASSDSSTSSAGTASPQPSPTPSETASPSPTSSPSPQASPTPTDGGDPDLSAGPVVTLLDSLQESIQTQVAFAIETAGTIKSTILGLLGLDDQPTPEDAIARVKRAVPTADPSSVPTVDPSSVPTVDPSSVPTADPSSVPTVDPQKEVDDATTTATSAVESKIRDLTKALGDLITQIKAAIKSLLGIDADNPPTADELIGKALTAASGINPPTGTVDDATGAAYDAIGTAGSLAQQAQDQIVTATANASGAIDTVTSTALSAAGGAGGTAGDAVATATAATHDTLKNLPPVLVGTVVVKVDDSSGTDFPLTKGHEYLFKTSGKYYYTNTGNQADALCANTPVDPSWSVDPIPPYLHLRVDGGLAGWKASDGSVGCAGDHHYDLSYKADGGSVKFAIVDADYTDGNITDATDPFTVQIWDTTAGAAPSLSGFTTGPLGIMFGLLVLLASIGEAATRRRRATIKR